MNFKTKLVLRLRRFTQIEQHVSRIACAIQLIEKIYFLLFINLFNLRNLRINKFFPA